MTLSNQSVMPTYGRFPIAIERGEGSYLWDTDGKKYLDFCMGIAVCTLGHSHPKLVEAISKQAASLMHCSNLYQIPQQTELADTIVETVVGEPGKVFFCNSGAEANDAMVKLARKFGYEVPNASGEPRHDVITFRNSFHGRTLGGIAATGQEKVKVGFDPALPGFFHVALNDLDALKAAITDKTVAIMFEPLQGEGGINLVDASFLKAVADLCREHNLLLMLDEVQCGIGRMGDWCGWKVALDDADIELTPDVVSWAKGLGGGFPIGAIWARDRAVSPERDDLRLCDVLGPGTHGSTYGGGPLASTAALTVIREIEEANLIPHVIAMEQKITTQVASWSSPFFNSDNWPFSRLSDAYCRGTATPFCNKCDTAFTVWSSGSAILALTCMTGSPSVSVLPVVSL